MDRVDPEADIRAEVVWRWCGAADPLVPRVGNSAMRAWFWRWGPPRRGCRPSNSCAVARRTIVHRSARSSRSQRLTKCLIQTIRSNLLTAPLLHGRQHVAPWTTRVGLVTGMVIMGDNRDSAAVGLMHAAVLRRIPDRRFVIERVPIATPSQPGQVLLEVHACGICGTDLHIMAGTSYRPALPFVLGHEAVGRVVAAHPTDLHWVDRMVAVSPFRGCGRCRHCHNGDVRLCQERQEVTGVLGAWGGFANYELVESAQLVPLPEGLSTTIAASLVDCGPTALNAVQHVQSVKPESVVVIGSGAIGRLVVQMLSPIVDRLAVVEPLAVRRAALLTQLSRPVQLVAGADEVTGDIDAVVECSGTAEALQWSISRLSPHGLLVLAGYAQTKDFDFADVSRKELTIRGVRSGSLAHLQAVLDLAADGSLDPVKPTLWPLIEINSALQALLSDQPPAKAVIDCLGSAEAR